MDALVRLHETHTGGGESHPAPSTILSPLNVSTAVPNVPLLNTSNKIPIEKWVTTNPTQRPVTSNTLSKQSQDAYTVTMTKVVKGSSTPAELKSTSNAILVSTSNYNANNVHNSVTTTASLLDEVMALPDRLLPNQEKTVRSRNSGQ